MTDSLSKAKRQRASVMGHFSKLVNKFLETKETLDVTRLHVLLEQADEYNRRFVKFDEIIIGLEAPEVDSINEPFVSEVSEKFAEDYMELKQEILALIESKKPTPDGAPGAPTPPPIRLPKLELPKFSGKFTEWTDFRNEFESLVADPRLSDVDRFRFLRSALGDNPKRIISSMEVTAANYKKAFRALRDRYDNKALIFRAHINEILSLQAISGSSADRCRDLLDKAKSHFRAMESLADPEQIGENLMISILLMKVDSKIQMKWEEESDESIPSWDEFTEFLEKYASTLEKIDQTKQQCSRSATSSSKQPNFKKHTTLVTGTTVNKCYKCSSSSHGLKECSQFRNLSIDDRIKEAKRLKICMKCLTSNHSFLRCKVNCDICKKSHNTLLHISTPDRSNSSSHSESKQSSNGPSVNQTLVALKNLDEDQALLASVIVYAHDRQGNKIPIHALLDSGSTRHYVSERLVRLLNVKKFKSNTSIGGIGGTTTSSKDCCNLDFESSSDNVQYHVQASILPTITGSYPPTSFTVDNWGIPSNLQLADPQFNRPKRIDLLIGAGLFWTLLKPRRLMLGVDLPMLQDTELGWIVVGSTTMPSPSTHSTLYAVRNCSTEDADDALNELVQRFWEVDSVPNNQIIHMSEEDKICEQHFISNFRRTDKGRYVVRLPFRSDPSQLGSSYEIARRRFLSLEKRLHQNPTLKSMYTDFIDEYEKLGHLEVLPELDFAAPHYFVPHHCVLKMSSSTTKLRVVFDASCKTSSGVSLNDVLYSGPKLQDDIFTLLFRFRLFKHVATTDIQKMYRQIMMDESDANFQLILWRTSKTEPLKILRLRTVTYGTAPGAYLSIRSLHQLAEDEGNKFPLGAQILLKDLYVDDALIGADTEQNLEEKLRQLQLILEQGGFKLGKYCSNSPQILSKIDPSLQEKYVEFDDHKVIKALGLMWAPETDVFRYKYEVTETTADSKRSILSQVARIFDPLGFLCPVVTLAKIFYQELWNVKLGWDDTLPPDLFRKWSSFRQQLVDLKKITVPRYLMVESNVISTQMHGFSDASEKAYGACVYLRCTQENGDITVILCCAKSRVAPRKTLTIARLELCAAKLLVDLVARLKSEVFSQKNPDNIYYWTDSSIVLSWLHAEPHRWYTFVAHRVARIQEATNINQWFHVPGTSNPADLISRGMTSSDLVNSSLWWKGPEFLSQHQSYWPARLSEILIEGDIEETRPAKPVLVAIPKLDLTHSMHFSTQYRGTCRAFAYALRFIKNCRSTSHTEEERRRRLLHYNQLKMQNGFAVIQTCIAKPSLADETEAEEVFLRAIQRREFENEYEMLKNDRTLPRNSCIAALAPFLDDFGLMRVGGRLKRSNLPYDSKHPILLPKHHRITSSLIKYFHHFRVCHTGPQMTLTALRARYWPIGGLRLCRSILHDCIWCFRLKPSLETQFMGDLPKQRVEPAEFRPFEVTGVDFAGLFNVRHHIRCKQGKQVYLSLFICFTTKAVYVDLVPDLTTKAFLRALRRFISDRGSITQIYSDNATNFKGACNYLQELKQMLLENRKEIEAECSQLHIQWSFIPPRTPHKGGLWEASIKLLKRIIRNVVGELNLTEDELRTVAKQAAAVINSRPITTLSSDPNDLEPLTPGHFLYGAPPSALPEPRIVPKTFDNSQSISACHRMQFASQQIWNRFRKEYLTLLQPRSKWLTKTAKFVPGTLVLLHDSNADSLRWPIGRIVSTMPDTDGVVRRIKVKTAQGEYERDVSKCAVLPETSQPAEVLSSRSTGGSVLNNQANEIFNC